MTRVYRRHSIDCMVDVYAPPWPGSEVDSFLQDMGAVRIILLPTLQSCQTRNRIRANVPLLSDEQVADNYRGFTEGLGPEHQPFMINNSVLNLPETVALVSNIVDREA